MSKSPVLHAHFLSMLGTCWDAARLAGLPLRLELLDGSVREGHPTTRAGNDADLADQLEHSGVAHHLELDGELIDAMAVRSYTVVGPPRR